jgi:paraquat-inducible protein B
VNDLGTYLKGPDQLPKARVRAARWYSSVVWVAPLIAAVLTSYLIFDRVREFGPSITIRFKDGRGLTSGISVIKYRGVQVGEVKAIELSRDGQYVLVHASLLRSAALIAREGAQFWIVRPQVALGNITGLSTVITGPEIDALPGRGSRKSEFTGLDTAPAGLEYQGLKLVLLASHVASLRAHSHLYYRGVEVGVVQDVQLSANGSAVEIHVLVKQRFAELVRSDTVFWNVSGAQFSAGLFNGIHLKVDSLQALAAGGIAMATPSAAGRPVKEGATFQLRASAPQDWLQWEPKIASVARK